MLAVDNYHRGELLAVDRAIDYAKFEALTQKGVTYLTKMKKGLVYQVQEDLMLQNDQGQMAYRVRRVVLTKHLKDGQDIRHQARIITHIDVKQGRARPVELLTNDMDFFPETIVDIYRQRWQVESLFKQLKQNFPLRYFYGQSANAIKLQIWVTLLANLLLMVAKSRVKRRWSFSNFATMMRINLMCYIDLYSFFESPEGDWKRILLGASDPSPQLSLFD